MPTSSSSSPIRVASRPVSLCRSVAATPRWPASASIRLASTLSVSKTVGFWNLRPMPSRAVSASSSRVEVGVLVPDHPAALGPGLAGDDVEHRGLAGAVRPDHRAQLALGDPRSRISSRVCSSGPRARRRASTRRAATRSTSSRSRSASSRERDGSPAVAGRPRVPQPARRRHRQHAPHRVLHRQALLARWAARAPRPARAARVRDAAARAHELRAAAARARAGRALLGDALPPRLVRWGTQLHDRFLLPHFVEQDLAGRARRARATRASASSRAWFAPLLEFRFPRIGAVVRAGVELELRHAIEPWHVLGEEQGAGRHRRATSTRRSSASR